MMRIKVNEAIARCEMNGRRVLKKDIAARLFPGVSEIAQQVNMTNLCAGRTKRITAEQVAVICEMCECTPNFLFGYESE